ncbi:hypothetical protein ACNOYE_04360 [Nannocystaceae bacterium ST9]
MLEKRVDELVGDLACYHGHRTLWLDRQGGIVHTEPDDMLEDHGFDYVATLFQPDRDQLTSALLRNVSVEVDRATPELHASWHQAGVAASLMPA